MGYPYGDARLVPDFGRRATTFIAVAVMAVVLALWLRLPIALSAIDDVALRIIVPAACAIVMAMAPRPATRLGRIAKDLSTVAIIAALFAGDHVPLLVASFPLVLAASALLSRGGLFRCIWS